MDINKKQKKAWYKRWWVWVIIVIVGIAMIQAIAEDKDKISDKAKEGADKVKDIVTNTKTPSFKIDSYINRPIADVAKEFDQTYNEQDSRQVKATKDGYNLVFEDGGKNTDSLEFVPTSKVTSATIDLPKVGKCSNDEVFNKTDEVIKASGLNPSDKGEKNPNVTLGAGYASYLNYKGDKTLELQVSCKYKDGPWQVIIVVRSEARS